MENTVSNDNFNVARGIASIYDQNAFWVKLMAIVTALYGVSLCFTIVGAIIGIPSIYCAVVLWQSVNLARAGDTENAVIKTMFYFKVFGILTLVTIVGFVLMMMLGMGAALSGKF